MPLRFRVSLLIPLMVALLLFEACLRIFQSDILPFVGQAHQRCIYIADRQTGYRYKPNSTGLIRRNFEIDNIVRINSSGFHDIERMPFIPDDTNRHIVVIGDSFTAELMVTVSKTWTQILEREIARSGDAPHVDVINLGLDGTGTDVHLTLLQENVLTYRPDIVILAFFENDLQDIQRKMEYRECYRDYVMVYADRSQLEILKGFVDEYAPSPIENWLWRSAYTYRVLITLYSKFLQNDSGTARLLSSNFVTPSAGNLSFDWYSEPADDLESLFARFSSLSKEHGFRFVVVPIPTKASMTGSLDVLMSSLSAQTLRDIDVIAVLPELTRLLDAEHTSYRELFWAHDGHLNEKGNEMLGVALSKALQ